MTQHTSLGVYGLLDWLAGCDSRDEMHAAIQAWLLANPQGGAQTVHAVFAQVRGGVSQDFLSAYSRPELAQAFISGQDVQLQQCLVVWEVEINRHPQDPYWTAPRGMAAAFHTLAEMPSDALSDETLRSAVDETGTALPSQRFREDVDAILDQSPDPRRGHRDVSTEQAALLDARVVAPAIAELEEIAGRIVRESGRGDAFDAAAWVQLWIHEPHPALGGRCPVYLLGTPEGAGQVRDLLWRQQSGAYS